MDSMDENNPVLVGLSEAEVATRVERGEVNKADIKTDKTKREIVLSNVCTYFNLIFLIISILLIVVGSFRNLTFLPIIIGNTVIGIVQELRAKKTLEKMSLLNAPHADVIRDGKLKNILSQELVKDDIVLLSAGKQICADATVISGSIHVNESLLTGEVDEIEKTPGSTLMSGSFVVSGECYAKLERVGADSYISRLSIEAKSMSGKEQSQMIRQINLIVKAVGIIIIPIAIILFWQSFYVNHDTFSKSVTSTVAAIIGMIPEGLYLLTTVALAISTMKLAGKKVLLHDMKSIETLARVDVLCVDKTGTITNGTPVVTDVVTADSTDADALIRLAASLEVASEHPLGEAIVAKAKEQGAAFDEVTNFEAIPGFGIKGHVGETLVFLGNEKWMRENGLANVEMNDKANHFAEQGKTPLYIGYNDAVQGLIVVADTVKESSARAIQTLHEMGIQVAMMTGDHERTAQAIASEVGIDRVFSEVLPQDKANYVSKLQEEGYIVAMVGDGINDAPALAQAQVGIAIGTGTDVAIESADAVLMKSDLMDVPAMLKLSRATIRNIKENLFWAFAYNVIGIPFAMGVLHLFGGPLLNPMIAGAAMSFSSVSVVLNALRLKRWKA